MPFRDHFQTLRIPHHATALQIRKAYYERLKFFHPDFFENDPGRRAVAEIETKLLNEAYEVLGSGSERDRYQRDWERHQNPLRPPEQTLALERSLNEVKADLAEARHQVLNLQVLVDQRTRDLNAANQGMRQSHERMQQLQRSMETYQDSARQLESRLLERSLEVQQLQARSDAWYAQVRQMESMLSNYRQETLQSRQMLDEYRTRTTELDAALLERKVEAERLVGRLNRAEAELAAAGEDRPRQGELWGKPSGEALAASRPAIERLQQRLADAEERLGQQQSLLAEAGRQIQALRDRTQTAESELRLRTPLAADSLVADDVKEELARQQAQIRDLGVALACRTDEVHQARQQIELQQDRLRALEGAEGAQYARQGREPVARAGAQRTLTPEPWLSERRAATILTGLLFALCVVAIALVWLTVSADSRDILAGLGRLGAALAGKSVW